MTHLPLVRIKMDQSGMGEVTVDGFPIPGCRGVRLVGRVQEVPRVFLELYAGDVRVELDGAETDLDAWIMAPRVLALLERMAEPNQPTSHQLKPLLEAAKREAAIRGTRMGRDAERTE